MKSFHNFYGPLEELLGQGTNVPLVNPDAFPGKKDCEKIARFMGWLPSTTFLNVCCPDRSPVCYWRHPDKAIELRFQDLDYTTDMNLFVAAWNKAIDETCSKAKEAAANELFYKLEQKFWKFTIEDRLPLLLEMIDFLNSEG